MSDSPDEMSQAKVDSGEIKSMINDLEEVIAKL